MVNRAMPHHRNPRRRTRSVRGFLLLELVIALALIGILAGGAAYLFDQHQRATAQLTAHHEAIAHAEHTAGQLVLGQTPDLQPTALTRITVEPIDRTAAPPQWQWVRITVHHEMRTAGLTALVRSRVQEIPE